MWIFPAFAKSKADNVFSFEPLEEQTEQGINAITPIATNVANRGRF
jgi:hypothetical protein